jgi:hypothetical protein
MCVRSNGGWEERMRDAMSDARERLRTTWPLWVLIALGTLLRTYGALVHPVDQDEIYTVMESRDLFHTALQPGIQSRPLYYLVQHALFWVTPEREPYTRLLPLLAGAFGLWLVARLTLRLAGKEAAIVATAVAALSPWHAYASETARYYGVVFALVTASYLLLLRALASDARADWLRAAMPVSVGLLVHPSFALTMAVPCALALLRQRARPSGWGFPTAARLVGFVLPCALAMGALLVSVRVAARHDGAGNGGARALEANLRLLPAIVEWASPVLVVAGLIGLWLAWQATSRTSQPTGSSTANLSPRDTRREEQRDALLLLALGGASSVLFVVAAAAVTATYADYAVGLLPTLFVGAGLLAATLAPGVRPWLAAVLCGALAPSLASHVIDGTRFDYRPAFNAIRQTDAKALTLVWPEATAQHYAPDLRLAPLAHSIASLDSLLMREGRVVAVASFKRFGLATTGARGLDRWLTKNCHTLQEFERPRFDVRVYRVTLLRCERALRSPLSHEPVLEGANGRG